MPAFRYILPGLPAMQARTAYSPSFDPQAGGGYQSYKAAVYGQPGTQGIPAPGPGVDQGNVAMAQMGRSRTSNAPAQFWPQLYYQRALTNAPNQDARMIRVWSDNLLPVPAVDPRGIPSTQFVPQRSGRGQAQIRTLPNLTGWPNVTG